MFKRLEQESNELEKKRRSGAGMGKGSTPSPPGRERE